jgi:hypothetical protein
MIIFSSAAKHPKVVEASAEADVAAIKRRAMLAAYSLLGIIPRAHSDEPTDDSKDWNLDASVLTYSESSRISVIEPTVSARKNFDESHVLNLEFTVDTISGATPIGTLPKKKTQTDTTTSPASGGGGGLGVTIDVPTAYMSDVRYGLVTSWQQPLGLGLTGKMGANFSVERDYQSAGVNFLLMKDFNKKNSTLSVGVAPEYDRSIPHGGVPVPFTVTGSPGSTDESTSKKQSLGLLAGWTQTVNRRTLMQWNYALTRENGTLSDPYKLLSRIDGVTGDPIDSIYEKRPDSRIEHSYFWLTRYHLDTDVISFSYRYYTDDWGTRSHTADLNYHWAFSENDYLEPRFRFYHQSQADFYRIGLVSGAALPNDASADYRLAKFDAYTIGARYGHKIGDKTLLVLRFDYYTQIGDSHPDSAIGIQKGFDLFPALQALIFQAQLSFDPSHVGEDLATVFQ